MSVLTATLSLPARAVAGVGALTDAVLSIRGLGAAVGDLHAELAGLRGDLASMPGDSRRLADDVEVVHETMRVMSRELHRVMASTAPVHEDLVRVEAGLAPVPDKFDLLLPKVDELARRLDELRSDLAGQLDGLRTDLAGLPFVAKT